MNELFRQFERQSGIDVYGLGKDRAKWESALEKFGEMIVRECCAQLIKQGEEWEQFARNPPKGQEYYASAAQFAAYRLKEDAVWVLNKHFGVEG